MSFRILLIFVSFLGYLEVSYGQYEFEDIIAIDCSNIKNQNRTGTCWSFATSSFIESELLRNGIAIDLSEMFVVRNIYKDKAKNYVLRQSKANFSQGSLAHDVINIIGKYGVVPESAYDGSLNENNYHDHSEMEAALKGFLDGVLESKNPSTRWVEAFDAILNAYMGKFEREFLHNGKKITPKELSDELGLNAEDYVNLTSFTHHPFEDYFILEIPDNYSNGSFYNIPITTLQEQVDHALQNGFSVAWDGDVSERGFSAKEGIAVLPEDPKREDLFASIGAEQTVSQENRQKNFMNFRTTDDHLMHIVGMAKDQEGNKYYKIKNSWGEIGPYNGYLYMSENYFRMKTVSVTLHKDALTIEIK